MANRYSRREFLGKSTLAGLATAALGSDAAAAKPMPTRVLGKTGARVSILAFGCGSRLDMYHTEEAAVAANGRNTAPGTTRVKSTLRSASRLGDAVNYAIDGAAKTRVGASQVAR